MAFYRYGRRRRRTYRRKSKRAMLSRVPRFLQPKIRTVSMPYRHYQSFVSATVQYQTFRMNSIYDPDYTGLGHQPFGYDQLELQYGRYNVIASRIRFRAQNNRESYCTLFWEVSPDVARTYTIDTLTESPHIEGHVRLYGGSSTGIANAGATATRTSKWYFPYKYYGLERNDDSLHSAFGNNPSKQLYLRFITAMDDGASLNNLFLETYIDYVVELSEPLNVAAST